MDSALITDHLINRKDGLKSLSVLVVGAGISGLSAAQMLSKVDTIDVKVVEARDRTGGRIYSAPIGDDKTLVDLGASWIHGIGKGAKDDPKGIWEGQWNPVYQYALDNGIKTSPTWGESMKGAKEVYIQADGSKDFPPRFWKQSDQIYDFFASQKSHQSKPNQSFGEVVRGKFLPKGASDIDKSNFEFLMRYHICHPFGSDPNDISAKYINSSGEFSGPEHVFNVGYSQITDTMAKGLDVELSSPITEVDYSNHKGKIVTTYQDGKQFSSDQIIVTVPLGVLRSGDINFKPEFTKAKKDAMGRLGLSRMDKVFLEFEEPFWDNTVDNYNYTGRDFIFVMNCYRHHTGKPILLLFNTAYSCTTYWEMGDDEVVAEAMKVLKIMFPGAPEKPKAYVRTNWGKDKYAQMSYTFPAVGCSPQDYDIVAASIGKNRVHFAGEHTNFEFAACTSTAMISGVKAAQKIIGSYVKACTTLTFYLLLLSTVFNKQFFLVIQLLLNILYIEINILLVFQERKQLFQPIFTNYGVLAYNIIYKLNENKMQTIMSLILLKQARGDDD